MPLTAYQRDAYLRHCEARVVSCAAGGRGFEVVLDDTVLYPAGGGQPSDSGSVGGLQVVDVYRDAGRAIVHLLPAALDKGAVEVVLDWPRRYDHMQQHTAQHLITALAQQRFGAATTSFHLGSERSDIELDRGELGAAELEALERQVNAAIREARSVRCRWVEAEQLEAAGARSRGLPEGHQGAVRLVEIEGIDLNTCGGTHVASTAELQMVKLLGTERMRRGTRLFYLAGGRVLQAMSRWAEREQALTRLLSCGPEEQVAAVLKLSDAARAADKARQALLGEVAAAEAERLAATSETAASLHRPDADLAVLQQIAAAALQSRPDLIVLLSCGDPSGAGEFLLAGPPPRVAALAPRVGELLEGRGGGPPGRFQGKCRRLDRRGEAIALLLE
ncbi:MAG TPA: alanyl-tRNA editing protein [Acidobacteriota bacterium]